MGLSPPVCFDLFSIFAANNSKSPEAEFSDFTPNSSEILRAIHKLRIFFTQSPSTAEHRVPRCSVRPSAGTLRRLRMLLH